MQAVPSKTGIPSFMLYSWPLFLIVEIADATHLCAALLPFFPVVPA